MIKLDKKTRKQYKKIILSELHDEKKEEFRQTFLDLHPSDQSEVFSNLDEEMRKRVYSYITPDEFAEVFEGLHINDQIRCYNELDTSYSATMLNAMFTDDVVTFLTEINGEKAEEILLQLEKDKADKVRILLAYAEETAGAVMTKEFISISSNEQANHVIDQLRHEAPEAEIIYYNYVVDEVGTLVGVVSLRDLIVAPPNEKIKNIMSTRAVSVPEDMDQEEVAHVIKKYDFLAVPVVSKQNKLLGIVTVDDIMDIVEDEVTEDFGEIAAAKGATDINLSAFTVAKKRSPWIITLMFFGLITGGIIGQFEETLEAVVLLAAFIPMIMDSAGNVGTQSLAVSVRGLALGTIERSSYGKIIRREFSTGAMIGLICMVLIIIMISLLYNNWILAFIVGFSILCTLSISAVIGAIVPLIINKLKFDPAIASGPFITTLNDIIGLLIYFSIATSLMDVL